MSEEYKLAKSILMLGINALVFGVIAIIAIVLFFTFDYWYMGVYSTNLLDNKINGLIWLTIMAIMIAAFGVAILLIITGSWFILTIDFNNNDVDKSKKIWGILTLTLIGPIGMIIFGSIAMKKIKSKSTGSRNTSTDNILEPIY